MKQLTSTHSAADLAACSVIAVDLAKRVFQVAGEDALGVVHYEHRIKSREAFTAFLSSLPLGCTVLMETGPGAQSWARQVIAQGRNACILPALHVEDRRSGAKNARNDALTICAH